MWRIRVGIGIIVLIGIVIVWLLQTESVILIAEPGQTVEVSDIPAITAHTASIESREVPIQWQVFTGRGFNGYYCEDETVWVERNDSDGAHDVALRNDCAETVTVEIWWYRFRYLNVFLDGYY
ncbi:MAG: hypothetical protein K8L97_23805 [Anaerolineae bacterium]|nr:hypothetical protein [Anaerolineae bacterium]